MVMIRFSNHAVQRFQQRGIRLESVELVVEWGEVVRGGKNRADHVRLFDRSPIDGGAKCPAGSHFDSARGITVVLSHDGCVITAYKTG